MTMKTDIPGRLIMDLDGTLCTQEKYGEYQNAKPKKQVIAKVNELWTKGWHVVIFTARGMNTHDGSKELAEQHLRALTEKWLKDNRVCYDELEFGKPSGDIYVDDKSIQPEVFKTWNPR